MRRRVVAVVLATGLSVGGCAATTDATGPASPASGAGAGGCAADVVHGPLPDWARGGFEPPDQPVTYAAGVNGDIVAVLFGFPLQAGPGPDRANKILWVGRVLDQGPNDLAIHGTSDSGARMDDTAAGGPGPSIVAVPSAGCWTLDLQWGAHRDEMTLPFGVSGP